MLHCVLNHFPTPSGVQCVQSDLVCIPSPLLIRVLDADKRRHVGWALPPRLRYKFSSASSRFPHSFPGLALLSPCDSRLFRLFSQEPTACPRTIHRPPLAGAHALPDRTGVVARRWHAFPYQRWYMQYPLLSHVTRTGAFAVIQ